MLGSNYTFKQIVGGTLLFVLFIASIITLSIGIRAADIYVKRVIFKIPYCIDGQ